jgi:SAM-dependent methyltransferase
MTEADLRYVADALDRGFVGSPCLELGAGLEGASCRALVTARGIRYVATDLAAGSLVDVAADFEAPTADVCSAFEGYDKFETALVLNVLEHTLEPTRVLDNAFALLRQGGTCVISTPVMWPIHDYPIDCARLLPDFYREYSRRRGYELIVESFRYLDWGLISNYCGQDGATCLPPPSRSVSFVVYSKMVHRIFRTFARHTIWPTYVAIGVVLRKPA